MLSKKVDEGDEACLLTKEGRSKRLDTDGQTQAKTLTIQFHLHLSTNNQTFQDIVHLIYFYQYNTFTEVHFVKKDNNELRCSLKRLIL